MYSGYETFVTHLVPGLVERGHEVIVYCQRELFEARPAMVGGVRLVYVPGIQSKSLSQLSHSLVATLDLLFRRVDVVLYVNSANGPFGPILRIFGKPCVINVDGLEWLRPKWKGLGARYFRLASWIAARTFDEIVTDAQEMARVYEREFQRSSTTIAYGATPRYSERPELVTEFGLTPGEYFLVVGRLIPDNNADLIVSAFAQSETSRKLVVVGDVPYQDSFAEGIRRVQDDRVVFTGYVTDQELLNELYCNCYVYIHGHEFGGTNPTALQALATGSCVLALDTPFTREVLDGERHGVFFPKTMAGAVAAIRRVDSDADLVSSMRTRARERIDKAYTWSSIVDAYDELLRSLAPAAASR